MNFIKVGELLEGRRVTQGHKDHALVGKEGQHAQLRHLLSSTQACRGHEHARVFPVQTSRGP